MANGSGPEGPKRESTGVPAAGSQDDSVFSLTGRVQTQHWQASTVVEPGLDQRGTVFFAAMQMTRMPMILTDPNLPDNPIVFANKAFLDLTEYEEDEVVGRNCRFLQGARTNPETVTEIRNAIAEHRAISLDILNYRRDGSPFWNGVFIAPVFDEDGKLLYFFASQLDITRRRTAEDSYRQSQKMEAIGQLTAGLAHDFNNLLQVVTGNLELIKERELDERTSRNLDRALRAAERGTKLTRQLLAFARKTRLEARPVDLSTLIRDFDEMINTSIGANNKDLELQLNLRQRLPACAVDPVHLEVALLNVLMNARDAMPKGGLITIATGSTRLDEYAAAAKGVSPGDYVTLSVIDEGTGMPAHVRERAVEPFFTTKSPDKGTGLGLAMVHGFVQQSHGKLEIDSELGRGTTVRMLLPVATEAAPETPSRIGAPATTAPEPAGRIILAVDDSEDVLSLAKEYLESLGYTVLTAADAKAALEVLDRHAEQIDLLFTDIIMPGGMNGLGLAEEARRRRPELPVLLTTGYNEDMVMEGPNRPSHDVLGKPYRRSELADRVNAALNATAREQRRTPSPFGAAEA